MNYIRYEESRPAQIREMLSRAPVAYVPIGALEWHGEHNPLGLDGLKAYALCQAAAEKTGGVLFPAMYWGACDTVPFPFTFRFGRGVVKGMVRPMLRQLKSMGFKMIVVLTGHYPPWLIKRLKKECRGFNRKGGAFAIGAPEQVFAIDINYFGDHAGMWESSIMMALRPELVELGALPDNLSALERMARLGVMGKDPKIHAGAEKGRAAIEHITGRLVQVVERTLKNMDSSAIEEAYQKYDSAFRILSPNIKFVIREALDVHSFRELIRYGLWTLRNL